MLHCWARATLCSEALSHIDSICKLIAPSFDSMKATMHRSIIPYESAVITVATRNIHISLLYFIRIGSCFLTLSLTVSKLELSVNR